MSEVIKGWRPSPSDLAWAAGHLARISHGGVWACSHGVYRIDHKARKVTLVALFPLADKETWRTIHGRSWRTFKAIGYKVQVARAAWKEGN